MHLISHLKLLTWKSEHYCLGYVLRISTCSLIYQHSVDLRVFSSQRVNMDCFRIQSHPASGDSYQREKPSGCLGNKGTHVSYTRSPQKTPNTLLPQQTPHSIIFLNHSAMMKQSPETLKWELSAGEVSSDQQILASLWIWHLAAHSPAVLDRNKLEGEGPVRGKLEAENSGLR